MAAAVETALKRLGAAASGTHRNRESRLAR
jgi:hypothetical protein